MGITAIPFAVSILLITLCCIIFVKKEPPEFEGETARPEPKRTSLYLVLFTLSIVMVFSVLLCQVISNVPSAILLSQFIDNYAPLLIGVNIGGVGTLISSLASLITFREYCSHNPKKGGKYLAIFSAFNFSFLIILTGVMLLSGLIVA